MPLVSIKNTFSFFFLVERQKLSKGKACDSLDNVPCSTCAKYLDGMDRKEPLEFEDSKCVWLPGINGCKTKAFAEKKGQEYVEICKGSFELLHNFLIFKVSLQILCLLLSSIYPCFLEYRFKQF